ncbi:MAG: glucosyltransferase domain-containing protein, partial [Clostridia bacterium]|nr:glucosyltransferase domain-containing protein [Clostridia bacterium]
MDRSKLMCENAAIKIKELAVKYKVPLITSFVVGILCYLYVFTNKFVNVDEIYYLFGKGVTVSSGRWGLEILRFVIPDYSMPWLHGISTLFLISVSVCFIIDIFEIKG